MVSKFDPPVVLDADSIKVVTFIQATWSPYTLPLASISMMTCTIAATENTSLALDAVLRLLSVLSLTTNDHTVLATTLLSEITDPQGEDDAQDTTDSPSGSSSGDDKEPVHIESTTSTAIDTKPTVTSSVVVDKDINLAEVKDAMAEGCILHTYRRVYFNVPAASDAAPPYYYVTRGRKIGVFSGWSNVGPNVLGVSRAIFAKVETIDQGIDTLMAAIDAGTAAQA